MEYIKREDIEEYIEKSQIGYWKFEIEDGIAKRMYIDCAMQRMMGAPDDLTPEECVEFFVNHIHPDDQHLMEPYSEELMRGNAEVVYRYLHPTAGEIAVRCGGRRIRNEGDVTIIVGYHMEIADTIQMEGGKPSDADMQRRSRDLQAQESQEYYLKLMDSASCGIVVYTIEGHTIQYMNKEALRIYGADSADEIQKAMNHKNFLRVDGFTTRLIKRLHDEDIAFDYECIIEGLDDVPKNVIVHSEVTISLQGERCVYSTIMDISENRALRDEKSILNVLCKDFMYVYLCDLENNTAIELKINQNTYQGLEGGFGQIDNIIGNDLSDYFRITRYYYDNYVDAEKSKDFIEMLTAENLMKYINDNGGQFSYRYKLKPNPTGAENFEIRAYRIPNIEGFKVIMSIRAIDDIVKAEIQQENALKEALRVAEAANKAKTAFLFNMSHDIRTPMNAIIGFRDLLEKHQDEPKKRQDYLDKLKTSNEVLLSIINNVLEMTRIEQGYIELNESAVGIEQFGDSIVSMFKEMMAEKGIGFEVTYNIQNPFIFFDMAKVQDIMINLMSNAYKYTNSGGFVKVTVDELPYDKEGYTQIQVIVKDNGIGMSEDFLPHIFEEFARENSTTDAKVEGTGLGMPIVKRLVDFLGGTIEVESKKNVGTTFYVTFTNRIADISDIVTHDREISLEDITGKRILLAEDNDLNAEIAIELLSETGLIMERATDGRECLEMVENSPEGYYDLVLMDIQMPNMNGYEATKAIRNLYNKRKANMPIVAMTANAFEEDKRNAFRAGVNGHISKPINVKELMNELTRILM